MSNVGEAIKCSDGWKRQPYSEEQHSSMVRGERDSDKMSVGKNWPGASVPAGRQGNAQCQAGGRVGKKGQSIPPKNNPI